ncbi:hypothetical protein DLAC_07261 [Tieghemostelium lacteum]|uniref:Uncharacterized protein n=1 Tax=Tieghemostelium lacteum TaxID=361077 RepID=A0A151ZC24_TIELA|nr:hypothetical protein DLAC_07261 [Tieghemostelium lacteum]|eukprot:KYQ91503.1 hypothetical protein DLAC_07261 [Tieghemostelium lacteum]
MANTIVKLKTKSPKTLTPLSFCTNLTKLSITLNNNQSTIQYQIIELLQRNQPHLKSFKITVVRLEYINEILQQSMTLNCNIKSLIIQYTSYNSCTLENILQYHIASKNSKYLTNEMVLSLKEETIQSLFDIISYQSSIDKFKFLTYPKKSSILIHFKPINLGSLKPIDSNLIEFKRIL